MFIRCVFTGWWAFWLSANTAPHFLSFSIVTQWVWRYFLRFFFSLSSWAEWNLRPTSKRNADCQRWFGIMNVNIIFQNDIFKASSCSLLSLKAHKSNRKIIEEKRPERAISSVSTSFPKNVKAFCCANTRKKRFDDYSASDAQRHQKHSVFPCSPNSSFRVRVTPNKDKARSQQRLAGLIRRFPMQDRQSQLSRKAEPKK